jgi:hypothetical protein
MSMTCKLVHPICQSTRVMPQEDCGYGQSCPHFAPQKPAFYFLAPDIRLFVIRERKLVPRRKHGVGSSAHLAIGILDGIRRHLVREI